MSIQLHYDLIPNKRIWLLPGNFDLLHGVLLRLCEEIVYPISCQITTVRLNPKLANFES